MCRRHSLFVALVLAAALASVLQAADRTEITFTDGRIFPESLTSTRNGAVFFGSLGKDSVYRAAPGASQGRNLDQAEDRRTADGARRARRRTRRRAVGMRVGDRRTGWCAAGRRNSAEGVQSVERRLQGELSVSGRRTLQRHRGREGRYRLRHRYHGRTRPAPEKRRDVARCRGPPMPCSARPTASPCSPTARST